MGFMDEIQAALGGFREEVYPKVRNWAARKADLVGGAASDASTKQILHGQGNYNLTKRIGEALGGAIPPGVAANLSDAAYLGNEAFTGALSKATGRPFFSDYGFRWKDVGINRGGQDRAVKELELQRAADRWKRRPEEDALLGRIDKEPI